VTPNEPVQLVQDIAMLQPAGPAAPGPAPTVERAIRDALGWTPKPGDTKGFIAALTRAYTPRPMDGTTAWDWTPRGYAIQADLGALTGAQASIYRRAQQALDASLPLLDALTPLIEYADPQATEASRAIVRAQLTQVVAELGAEGGPSVQLVDRLLDDLTGADPATETAPASSEDVEGQLGTLRERFGLKRDLINTVEEEQNFTSFIVLADYVLTIWRDWESQRAFFSGDDDGRPFFGTQLVLISRQLSVAAESIREVEAALAAVFIGPAERETLSVTIGTSRVFLGAMLDWAEKLITNDGPTLIEDGGIEGALSLAPTFETLIAQVNAFNPPTGTPPGFPPLYDNAVVRSALTAFRENLEAVHDLIEQLEPGEPVLGFPLRPPAIGPIAQPPSDVVIVVDAATSAPVGFVVALRGSGFAPEARLLLRDPLGAVAEQPAALTVRTPRGLSGQWANAPTLTGSWELVVRQDDVDHPVEPFDIA
jgi:hypothetical protein